MLRPFLLLSCCLLTACAHEHVEDQIVEARGFVITDEAGQPHGLWEYRPDRKTTVFSLLDEEQRLRANLMVIGDQPTFTLLDKQGTVRANLSLPDGDTPSLTLSDDGGAERLQVGLGQGAPRLRFLGPDGKERRLTVQEGAEGLVLQGQDGQVLATIPAGS